MAGELLGEEEEVLLEALPERPRHKEAQLVLEQALEEEVVPEVLQEEEEEVPLVATRGSKLLSTILTNHQFISHEDHKGCQTGTSALLLLAVYLRFYKEETLPRIGF